MAENIEQQLNEVREAIARFDVDRARELLRPLLKDHKSADILYEASRVALDDDHKHELLKEALELDPFHEKARAATKGQPEPVAQTEETEIVVVKDAPPAEQPKQERSLVELFASDEVVKGTTTAKCNLYTLPNPKSTVRTELAEGALFIPLTRNETTTWYNVLYEGVAGNAIVGWLETEHASELRFQDQMVPASELPLTNYEWNSREELKQLYTMKYMERFQKLKIDRKIVFLIVLFFVFIAFILIEPILGFVIYLIWSGLIVFYVIKALIPSGELPGIQRIIRERRSEDEKVRTSQMQIALFNAALDAGKTAITRYVPDRKEVTTRNK